MKNQIFELKRYTTLDWLNEDLSVVNKTEQRRIAELVITTAGAVFDLTPSIEETKYVKLMDWSEANIIHNMKVNAFNKAVRLGAEFLYQQEVKEAKNNKNPAKYIEAVINEYKQEIKKSEVNLSELLSSKTDTSGIDAALYKKIMGWNSPTITNINGLYVAKVKYKCTEKLEAYMAKGQSVDSVSFKLKEAAIQLVVDRVDKKIQCQKSLGKYIELKQEKPNRSVRDIHKEIDSGDLSYNSLNNWAKWYKEKLDVLISAQEK